MMQILCSLIIFLTACSSFEVAASETVQVTVGEPFILNFGYDGPTVGINHDLTKDGEEVTVDNTRTYKQLDKLYFTEVYELDSGDYHLAVTGKGVDFEKTIVLSVVKSVGSPHSQSQGSHPPELAVLKVIAEEQRKVVKRNVVEEDDSLATDDASNPFNHLRSLTPAAAKHAEARVKFEKILIRARRQAGNQEIPPLAFFPMLQFAQCIDPPMPQNCSSTYRSTDGTCNNIDNPLWGASNTAFRRLLSSEYEDGIYVPIGANQTINGDPFTGPWPSPRHISRIIITDSMSMSTRYNMIFTVFGQAIALDFTRTGQFNVTCPQSCDNLTEYLPFCWPIPVEPDDPVYGTNSTNHGKCRPFKRSVAACMMSFNSTFEQPREHINLITHYLDVSGVYGNNDEQAHRVRSFTGGQLRQSARNTTYKGDLPILPNASQFGSGPPLFFFGGDVRIENYVHQTVIYTLWYRLHNYIVGRLAEINPCWDDEKLFQEGRKIVGGIWQVIIYREYLPVLFGDQFDKYVGSYTGYDASIDATIPTSFVTAAGRFGHSMIYDLTNRFDSKGDSIAVGQLSLRHAFFNPMEYYNGGGVDPLARGMLADQSMELDQFLSVVLTTQLFPSSASAPFGNDLAALNIQRARERGVPPYRTWQRYCQNIHNVTASFMSSVDQQLQDVYGEDGYRDGIDLWVGGISEERLSKKTPLGPTFACIIGQTYSNLRHGDRFYWENPSVFTDAQRESLSKMTMSKVICENADNIPRIRRSAFSLSGRRVRCRKLPFVDLTLWRDTGMPCNITRNVRVRPRNGTATATFSSDNPQTMFLCKLDRNRFQSCTSPVTYTNLSRGRHRIIVEARCPCKTERDVRRFTFQIR